MTGTTLPNATLEVIDNATYCECCDEEIVGKTYEYAGDTMCFGCYKSNRLDEAKDELETADGEVESMESEIADARTEYEEELKRLKEEFEERMTDLKERLAEQKKEARKARKLVESLEA